MVAFVMGTLVYGFGKTWGVGEGEVFSMVTALLISTLVVDTVPVATFSTRVPADNSYKSALRCSFGRRANALAVANSCTV